MDIQLGSIEILGEQTFDIVLANINRNILMEYLELIHKKTATGGKVLLSGFITEDREQMIRHARGFGFQVVTEDALQNWIVLLFEKMVVED